MRAVSCGFFAQLQVTAAGLAAARDERAIRDMVDELKTMAEMTCANAVALIDAAAEDEEVRLLLTDGCRPRDVRAARDKLLGVLCAGCLRCGGASPFDDLSGRA